MKNKKKIHPRTRKCHLNPKFWCFSFYQCLTYSLPKKTKNYDKCFFLVLIIFCGLLKLIISWGSGFFIRFWFFCLEADHLQLVSWLEAWSAYRTAAFHALNSSDMRPMMKHLRHFCNEHWILVYQDRVPAMKIQSFFCEWNVFFFQGKRILFKNNGIKNDLLKL